MQVGRVEQIETAAQAKARRGPKAKILRQLTRIHTPATATGNTATHPQVSVVLYSEQHCAQYRQCMFACLWESCSPKVSTV